MPQQKLTIVPVTLHTNHKISPSSPAITPSTYGCKINTATLEIFFCNGVDTHIIQTVMGELKQLEI